MKKLLAFILGIVLCSVMIMPTLAADQFYEISDEELGLPSEEEERAIVEEERKAARQNKAITDEMYTAFYGNTRGDIDTVTDVNLAKKYFDKMNYITETYINPTITQVNRLFYCTEILLYAGHAQYDRVWLEPAPNQHTENNRTGVYMGESNLTDGKITLIGLGKKSMSPCRFVMFAACETANPDYKTNIAKSVVDYGAEASIGWKVKVNSTELHNWEGNFFRYIENGSSLRDARTIANNDYRNTKFPDILESQIYGNENIVLSKNRSKGVRLADYGLIEVDKALNIDCANGDIEELTQYLEENVKGFDSEACKVEMISNSVDGRNEYTVLYSLHINGFETAFRVIVFVEDDTILYSSGLNDVNYDELAAFPALLEESYEDEIETAKKEALKEVPETADVESQKVRKFLDENLTPQLIVETTCIDRETGGGFLLGYIYDLK